MYKESLMPPYILRAIDAPAAEAVEAGEGEVGRLDRRVWGEDDTMGLEELPTSVEPRRLSRGCISSPQASFLLSLDDNRSPVSRLVLSAEEELPILLEALFSACTSKPLLDCGLVGFSPEKEEFGL